MFVKHPDHGVADFFATHAVFTVSEFAAWRSSRKAGGRAAEALLAYHVRHGRLVRIRKGLYAVVPPGFAAATLPVDPFLVAGKLTTDAVLAFHTALEFHGRAHSPWREFYCLTSSAARPIVFRGMRFQPVHPRAALQSRHGELSNVHPMDRMGTSVRVTSLERTMVDVLDRPRFGGDWEEIWRSLESVEFFDLDAVVNYALLLDNATTVAKVGFFLEQHGERLMVEDRHLEPLRKCKPRVPHYLSRRNRRSGKLVAGWNLVVPSEVLERRWQEVA